MSFDNFRESQLEYQILTEVRNLHGKIDRLERIMSTVPTGLAALQQADTDLKNAVVANASSTASAVQKISDLLAQLANSEDPAVASAAADIEAQVAAITANTTAIQNALNPTPPAGQ